VARRVIREYSADDESSARPEGDESGIKSEIMGEIMG
jgi:hypothetical protein